MQELLLKLGLPGVVILGLSIAVVALFRAYKDVQDKRITDAKEMLAAWQKSTEEGFKTLDAITRTRAEKQARFERDGRR